jgi:hypothetical protein
MKTMTTFTSITDDELASVAGGKDPGAGGDIGSEVGHAGRVLGDALAAAVSCPAPPRVAEPSRPGRATTDNTFL